MKTLIFAFLFCFLFGSSLGASYTWTGASVGDWGAASNWNLNLIPGSGDTAIFTFPVTVNIGSAVNLNILMTTNNLKVVIPSTGSLTVNNITQSGTNTFMLESGASLIVNGYFLFSGANVNFDNQGTVTLNPLTLGNVNQGALYNNPLGNTIMFKGTLNIFLFGNFYVPSGFDFASGVTHTFQASGFNKVVTFAGTPTIQSNGWTFVNDLLGSVSVSFQNGANILGSVGVTISANAYPSFTFAGTFSVNTAVTWNVIPSFISGSPIIVNGQGLTFNNNGVTFNAPSFQGSSTISFSNTQTFPTTASFGQDLVVNSNFAFNGWWIFNGNSISWANAYTLNFNLTLTNCQMKFLSTATNGAGSLYINGGSGSILYTNSLVSSNSITYTGFLPVFDCTAPANAFSITGSASMGFPNGFTINGCTLTSTPTFTVSGNIRTQGGNSTMPSTPTVTYQNAVTFTGIGSPSNSLYSITIPGSISVPTGNAYTASNVEVIIPSSLTMGDNTALNSNSFGLFSLNGGASFGSGVNINGLTAFPAGSVTLTAANRVDFNNQILLRNTVLGGTADIWHHSSIVSTKGTSTITNPNFKFKNGVILNYLWDNKLPNTGCMLVINTNGVTGTRFIEGSVSANTKSNIVFDDNININMTASITSVSDGSVTFRTSGQTSAFITSIGSISFSGNTYINHTNFHFMGLGSYTFNNNLNLFTQGGLNFPAATGDSLVSSPNILNVYVVANSTFGQTVTVDGNLNTNDFDQNSQTTNVRLTLDSAVSEYREIKGAYTLGTDLTFNGNVKVSTTSNIDSVGTIQILGNTILLNGANASWKNRVVLTSATTILSVGSQSITFDEQSSLHGLYLPGTLTVNSPATVNFNNLYSLSFSTSASLTGTGTANFNNLFVSGSNAVTINPQTVTLQNVTFIGTGSFTLSPVDNSITFNNLIRSYVAVTVSSSTVTMSATSYMSPTVVFSANPLTLNGNDLYILPGAYTVNGQWNDNANLFFQGDTTLSNTASFNGTGALSFNTTLTLSRNLVVPQSVTFGFDKNFITTVSNGGFVLYLTGSTVVVKGIVVSNGGSIVSSSPSVYNTQSISGGGVIDSSWTWSNSVQFGNLNVTSARTLTFDLYLTNGQTTYFNDGVTFNGGTFNILATSDVPTLGLETSASTTVATTLGPNIILQLTGTSFTFSGASTLTVNGTVNCATPVTFSSNVVFGYITPTTSNAINLNQGTTQWGPSSASLLIYRNSIVVGASANVIMYPSLTFEMLSTTVSGSGSMVFMNSLTIVGTSFQVTSNSVTLGVISITSQQNNTLSGLRLNGAVTFISTTTPWVEPVVSLATSLTQTMILNGPVRMASPTFGGNSKVTGTARLAITDSLTISSTTFTFQVPVQLYVTSPTGTFLVSLSGANLNFPNTPSLFNPLGYNLNSAMNLALSTANSGNTLTFNLNSALALGDVTVNSGILRFSSNSVSSGIVRVMGLASLWVDGTALTCTQLEFNQNTDGSNPSSFIYSVSSANPPTVTTQKAVYKGVISIPVFNFNWDGTAITAITATSANSANANFLAAYGTTGYTYTSTRSGNNMQIRRTANPSVSPFPTQSNGPSPAVNSAAFASINIFLFALTLIFFILN